MTEQNKIMVNLEKNAGNRGHIIIFFPYYFNCRAKKSTKIKLGKIYDIFPPLSYGILGGKYGKREIKSYDVS